MLILGIETSCDETAAAVVRDGRQLLAGVVVSQVDAHREYGGVVPELASRKHIEAISVVIDQALNRAGIAPTDLEGIGVTRGPGLIGSLLVGIGAAKGMALALGLPICGVNHLHGHLFSVFLERSDIEYPFVGLVVSGGHTNLYVVRGPMEIDLIGKTRDDAAGEAFDKVAKLLGLGYPGGAAIEEHASGADAGGLKFPRALINDEDPAFSFSGLKTAVLRHVEERLGVSARGDIPGSFHSVVNAQTRAAFEPEIRRIARAFQDAVTDVLAVKGVRAARKFGCRQIVVTGGVAANRALRERITQEASGAGVEAAFPSFDLCTDNAAMIAARAETLLAQDCVDGLDFDAKSR